MKVKLYILIFILFNYGITLSQSLIGSSGNSVTNDRYSVSWSIGELSVNSYSSLKIDEGFQQPFLEIVTGIDDSSSTPLAIIFPNPTSAILNIEALSVDKNTNVEIIDPKGSIVLTSHVENLTKFDLTNYKSGLYTIRIYNNNISQLFRVIKN